MTQECIFCRIANKEIPSQMVYADDSVVAFRDIQPVAPVHVVIIPRKHIPSLAAASEADSAVLGHVLQVARIVAEQEGVAESGYRVVNNCGPDALQTVQHVHFHLIGGKALGWPPG